MICLARKRDTWMIFDAVWWYLIFDDVIWLYYTVLDHFPKGMVWLAIISTSRFFSADSWLQHVFPQHTALPTQQRPLQQVLPLGQGLRPWEPQNLEIQKPQRYLFYVSTCSTVCMYIYSMFIYITAYIYNHLEIRGISNWIVSNRKMIKDFRYGW